VLHLDEHTVEVAGATVIRTKAGIVETTLREMRPMSIENEPPFGDELDYADIISKLQHRLPERVDIKTCEDFRHLKSSAAIHVIISIRIMK
jgi:hypothetical protein